MKLTDHDGQASTVTCTVRGEDFERMQSTFGVDEARLWEEINVELKGALESEARKRNVARLFKIGVTGHAYPYWQAKEEGISKDLKKEVKKLDKWLKKTGRHEKRFEIVSRALQKRGFVFKEPDLIQVDYERIINDATGPLADCARALREFDSSAQRSRLASLFLAFFQSLEYVEIGERDENGRLIRGFWVPTEVLAQQAGDCDSKGAAFCAMWRQTPEWVLLALDRKCNHALVGVKGTSAARCQYRVGNLNFVLYEVVSGVPPCPCASDYDYVLIEPAGSQ